jgi:hypothetical protein
MCPQATTPQSGSDTAFQSAIAQRNPTPHRKYVVRSGSNWELAQELPRVAAGNSRLEFDRTGRLTQLRWIAPRDRHISIRGSIEGRKDSTGQRMGGPGVAGNHAGPHCVIIRTPATIRRDLPNPPSAMIAPSSGIAVVHITFFPGGTTGTSSRIAHVRCRFLSRTRREGKNTC